MGKANIVVVEDEILVAMGIKKSLERLGYDVSAIAATGDEALKEIIKTIPDLVLMDIRLKGDVDGIDIAERIKEDLSIPVIYLTAYSDDKTIKRAKKTGSFGYILKPFEENTLNAAIEIALYKAKQEKRLKEDNEWFSIILRSLDEGVIVSDTKGAIRFINTYGENILKEKQERIFNEMVQDIFKVYDRRGRIPIKLPITTTVIEGNVNNRNNCILIDKEKNEILVDYSIAPLKNVNENTIGLVLVFKESIKEKRKDKIIQKELETPLEIQKKLLPEKEESIFGVKINWLFHPSSYGSGDLFNFFGLDENHLGFYILDVMGHGFSAALFSIILNRFLSPATSRGGILKRRKKELEFKRRKTDFLPDILSPQEVILELNKRFYFKNNNYPFFTVVYGIFNKITGQVKLVRAGHPFPIFQEANGETHFIKSTGSVVGIKSDVVVEECNFIFNKGDRIFLYSDGLVESLDTEKDQVNQELLLDVIKQNRDIPLKDLIQNIENDTIKLNKDKGCADDIALLVLERL